MSFTAESFSLSPTQADSDMLTWQLALSGGERENSYSLSVSTQILLCLARAVGVGRLLGPDAQSFEVRIRYFFFRLVPDSRPTERL